MESYSDLRNVDNTKNVNEHNYTLDYIKFVSIW